MHVALQRLGFTTQAATDIMGDQGIDSLEKLRVLDDKEVESLFKKTRRTDQYHRNHSVPTGRSKSEVGGLLPKVPGVDLQTSGC